MYLQAHCITKSTWSAITVISFFNQSWKEITKIHIPDFLVYIDRISNRMQHLIWDQKSKKIYIELFKLMILSANKKLIINQNNHVKSNAMQSIIPVESTTQSISRFPNYVVDVLSVASIWVVTVILTMRDRFEA